MNLDQERILELVRVSVQNAENFAKTAKTYPRPSKEFNATLLKHKNAESKLKTKEKSASEEIKLNNVASTKHSSLKKLSDLDPILLRDMHLNKIHEGKYLLCRTIETPFYLTSLTTLIQDGTEDIENLCLYNFCRDYNIEPACILPKFSILLIKEPYLTSSMNNIEDFYIRVESPSDVIILTDSDINEDNRKFFLDKWFPDCESDLKFEKLSVQGNKLFSEKNYYEAVRFYTKALNLANRHENLISSTDVKKTLNNRSLANLKLEKYFCAYQDAQKSLRIQDGESKNTQNDEKAFFRLGKAAYSMRQFESAFDAFTKCYDLNNNNKDAQSELSKTKQRMNEAKTGQYNFKSAIDRAKNQNQLRLDVADFVSSDIEVISLNNDPNYKGVVAKSNLSRNTLIVVGKAGSIAYEQECVKKQILTINFLTHKMDLASQSLNVINIISKVYNDPYLAQEIYKLYPGPSIDRHKVIDDSIVDTARLEAILTFNSFKTQSIDFQIEGSCELCLNKEKDSSGIWIYPSYFNHSCVPNAKIISFYDVMLIYTNRDIKQGEEIFVNYIGMAAYKKRSQICLEFGFKCRCVLCKLDRSDKSLEIRQDLIEKGVKKLNEHLIIAVNSLKIPNVKYANEFVELVRDSYKANVESKERDEELKLDLLNPLMTQAQFYMHAVNFVRAAEIFMQAFETFKKIDESNSTLCVLEAVLAYSNAGMGEEMRRCLVKAKENFIGYPDYFNYICKNRLHEIEHLNELLNSI